MYALDQVLRPDFSRSWYEAVALVQEVARALGDLTTVPTAEDLYLEEDGTIAIGFASEVSQHPVTALAALLVQLLEGVAAPPQLCSLAADNAKTPPAHESLAGFTRALAFYERPDRQSDVRAVVTRLASRRAASDAEHELERLRQRIASDGEVEAAKKPTPRKRLDFPVHQSVIAAGILVAVLGTVAVARMAGGRSVGGDSDAAAAALPTEAVGAVSPTPAVTSRQKKNRVEAGPVGTKASPAGTARAEKESLLRPSSPKPALTAGPTQREAAVQAKPPAPIARATAGSRAISGGAAHFAVKEKTGSTPRVAPTSGRTRASVAPASAASVVPAPGASVVPPPKSASAASVGPAPKSASGASVVPAFRPASYVYSAAEPEVMPARLTRTQLPQQPAPGVDTGYFDIVVDEKGDVEFVKLHSPMHRYQDRMLVAAAKAWKFRPALLNGTPVKYRLQIPIILPDLAR
jgi:hypothetical protein